jgi:hypothetical protein
MTGCDVGVCTKPAVVTVDGQPLCVAHGRIRALTALALAYRLAADHAKADGYAAAATDCCVALLDDPDVAVRLARDVIAAAELDACGAPL